MCLTSSLLWVNGLEKKKMRKKKQAKGNSIRVGDDGPPCPRCCRPMEIREHVRVSEKMVRKGTYYTRWFYCSHSGCLTNTVVVPDYKVTFTGPLVVWE